VRRAIDFAERFKALTGCDRLPWHIVQQQEEAKWGDAVVEQCLEIDDWSAQCVTDSEQERSLAGSNPFFQGKVATLCPQFESADPLARIVATVWRRLKTPRFPKPILSLSWSHHREVMDDCEKPAERYFYIVMAVRERWSVREFRRLIDSALFLRYMSVKRDPERKPARRRRVIRPPRL
jgi:hypothetical protein